MKSSNAITAVSSQERVVALWLDKRCVIVAWLGIFLAMVTPPDGLGFSVCWLQSTTGIPCIGCGLTRSLSCALRGMFEKSWHYHPMGLPILALFLITAGQSILPGAARERVKMFLQNNARPLTRVYIVFVVTFVVFGSARALFHYFGG